MPHDASCELKHVAHYYVTLQCAAGRSILGGFVNFHTLFFWHTRNQSCTKMSTGFVMSFRAHEYKNLILDESKSHEI